MLLKPWLQPDRDKILKGFNIKDRETLEVFNAENLIPPHQIEKLDEVQHGLFIATMKRDFRSPTIIGLKHVALTAENCNQLVKLFRRRYSLQKDQEKTWVYPKGITALHRPDSIFGKSVKPGPFFLVLDWPGIKNVIPLTAFLQEYRISAQVTWHRIFHDIAKCVQNLIQSKILNQEVWNFTTKNLYVENGRIIKMLFYGLHEDRCKLFLPDHLRQDASLDAKVVCNLGTILRKILEKYPRFFQLMAIKTTCLDTQNRIKLNDLVGEIEGKFPAKNGQFRKGKYRNQSKILKTPVDDHADGFRVEPSEIEPVAELHDTVANTTGTVTNFDRQNTSNLDEAYITRSVWV